MQRAANCVDSRHHQEGPIFSSYKVFASDSRSSRILPQSPASLLIVSSSFCKLLRSKYSRAFRSVMGAGI